MEDKLQESMSEVLEFLRQGMESDAAFASEQAPLVVQEILHWGIVSNLLGVVALVGLAVILAIVGYRISQTISDYKTYQEVPMPLKDNWFFGRWCFPMTALVFLGLSFIPLSEALKIWVAPRLYLIEQVSGMLR